MAKPKQQYRSEFRAERGPPHPDVRSFSVSGYVFAGSERGAEHVAAFYTLIETAKLDALDSEACLRHRLTRNADLPGKLVAERLPWN